MGGIRECLGLEAKAECFLPAKSAISRERKIMDEGVKSMMNIQYSCISVNDDTFSVGTVKDFLVVLFRALVMRAIKLSWKKMLTASSITQISGGILRVSMLERRSLPHMATA